MNERTTQGGQRNGGTVIRDADGQVLAIVEPTRPSQTKAQPNSAEAQAQARSPVDAGGSETAALPPATKGAAEGAHDGATDTSAKRKR